MLKRLKNPTATDGPNTRLCNMDLWRTFQSPDMFAPLPSLSTCPHTAQLTGTVELKLVTQHDYEDMIEWVRDNLTEEVCKNFARPKNDLMQKRTWQECCEKLRLPPVCVYHDYEMIGFINYWRNNLDSKHRPVGHCGPNPRIIRYDNLVEVSMVTQCGHPDMVAESNVVMGFALKHVVERIMRLEKKVEGCIFIAPENDLRSIGIAENFLGMRWVTCIKRMSLNQGIYMLDRVPTEGVTSGVETRRRTVNSTFSDKEDCTKRQKRGQVEAQDVDSQNKQTSKRRANRETLASKALANTNKTPTLSSPSPSDGSKQGEVGNNESANNQSKGVVLPQGNVTSSQSATGSQQVATLQTTSSPAPLNRPVARQRALQVLKKCHENDLVVTEVYFAQQQKILERYPLTLFDKNSPDHTTTNRINVLKSLKEYYDNGLICYDVLLSQQYDLFAQFPFVPQNPQDDADSTRSQLLSELKFCHGDGLIIDRVLIAQQQEIIEKYPFA